MRRIAEKLSRLAAVLFAASAVTFLMVDLLPGDAAYEIAGPEATMEDVEAIREELGLNRNVFVRYEIWLRGVLGGDRAERSIDFSRARCCFTLLNVQLAFCRQIFTGRTS